MATWTYSPSSAARETTAMRSLHSETRESPPKRSSEVPAQTNKLTKILKKKSYRVKSAWAEPRGYLIYHLTCHAPCRTLCARNEPLPHLRAVSLSEAEHILLSTWLKHPRNVPVSYRSAVCAQSCLTLQPHRLRGPPGSSVQGVSHATTLEWVVTPFSRGSSRPRD